MECKYCKSTWNSSQSVRNCPFCGKMIFENNTEIVDVSSAIQKIIYEKGVDILLSPKVVMAYVMDYVQGFEREKKLLRNASMNGILEQFQKIYYEKEDAQRNIMIQQVKNLLMKDAFFAEEYAILVINIVLKGIGVEDAKCNIINDHSVLDDGEKKLKSTDSTEIRNGCKDKKGDCLNSELNHEKVLEEPTYEEERTIYEPFGLPATLIDNNDYFFSFKEVEIDDEGGFATICFDIFNHTSQNISLWIDKIYINTKEVSWSAWGSPYDQDMDLVEAFKDEYWCLYLNDILADSCYNLVFDVSICDEDNNCLATTDMITLKIDLKNHTVEFDGIPTRLNYTVDDDGECCEGDDEYCEFEDISFDILKNDCYQVQYMNPEVDDDEVSLTFYIRNDTDEKITICAHNVFENGKHQEYTGVTLGAVSAKDAEIIALPLNNITSEGNGNIELSIEIYKDSSEKLVETNRVRIDIDFVENVSKAIFLGER